jgi:hypothetical protein
VLEVDNMILDLFAANNIISTQLFNFSFAFDLSDFIPINLINNFISERINVYIDMYLEDENGEKTKVQEKDFYTNYEFIPRYNVCTGKYDETENVFDYLNDNVSTDLINKNKLVQSTFHWVLKNNKSSIFNLYNGFSPIVKNDVLYKSGTSISNSETNLFTDVFDITKNPQADLTHKSEESTLPQLDDAPLYINKEEIAKTVLNYVSFPVARFSDILCGNSLPHGSNLPLHRISSSVSITQNKRNCKMFLTFFAIPFVNIL